MKLFVTGTDTGVGKTWVSAALASQALAQGQSVIYYKPVQTGTPACSPPEDPTFIRAILGDQVPAYNRYDFNLPVTPAVADPQGTIDFDTIAADVDEYARQTDLLLVEGAGGLMVPMSRDMLMIDLVQRLEIPVLLVSHTRLGTMNHTLLSIEALQRREIPMYGIVFNFYPSPDEMEETDIAVKTLMSGIAPHLPQDVPVWTCRTRTGEGRPRQEEFVLSATDMLSAHRGFGSPA